MQSELNLSGLAELILQRGPKFTLKVCLGTNSQFTILAFAYNCMETRKIFSIS